jgi:hypothetical protein
MKPITNLLLPFLIPLFVSCNLNTLPINNVDYQPTQSSQSNKLTPTEANNYVGLTYPPLPNSIRTSTSWESSISPLPSTQSWNVAVVTDDNNSLLWLSKTLYHDKNGKAYLQVSDAQILPIPVKDYVILVSTCLSRGLLDPKLIVLAKIDQESLEKRYLLNTNIVMAWKANLSTGKLEQIDTDEIECYAETFLEYP